MGVNVVGGSFGRITGDDNLELQLMVEYGMNPMQAIVAHTKKGAEVIRMSDRLGTLEVGKLADLIVVDGDPLADVKILQNRKKIQLVMKGGEIFRSDL
jgi:imidazolonepropionase-like amidohydrolase